MSKLSKIFADNLRRARGERSQAQMAEFLDLGSQTTYHNYESGRVPKPEVLSQIAEKLNCEVADLFKPYHGLYGDVNPRELVARPGQSRVGRRIPVVSWANAGKGNNYSDLAEFIEATVDTDSKDDHALAIIIEGDSMEPRFLAGDIVVLAPSSEPGSGNYVVARLAESGQVFFKKFYRTGPDGNTIRLESLNPNYAPILRPVTDFRFIYPAIELHAKLR